MSFTVYWTDDARLQLAEIWTRTPDRAAVNRAVELIDDALGRDPENRGRPQGDKLRSIQRPPLEVLFDVSRSDRTVEILLVSLRRTDLN